MQRSMNIPVIINNPNDEEELNGYQDEDIEDFDNDFGLALKKKMIDLFCLDEYDMAVLDYENPSNLSNFLKIEKFID